MKSLFEFIIDESLVNREELEKNINIKFIDRDEFINILNKEYNKGKDLWSESANGAYLCEYMMGLNRELFYDNYTKVYQINYNNTNIGLFGVYYPVEIIDLYDKSIQDLMSSLNETSPKDNKNDIIYTYNNDKNKKNNAAYIIFIVTNRKAKQEIDINQFALVKILYDKLIELCKKEFTSYKNTDKLKYIFAFGKDEKIQKQYQKLFGFKIYGLPDKNLDDVEDAEYIKELYDTMLYKKI